MGGGGGGGGGGKALAMLKGGTTSCGVVFTHKLEGLAILRGGGPQKFPLFKKRGGGGGKSFTLS